MTQPVVGWGSGSVPITGSLPEGFTLAEALQRIRQVLPKEASSFTVPQLGAQGLTLAQMRDRVRKTLADANAEAVTDTDVKDYLNEGQQDLAGRTQLLRTTQTATADGSSIVAAPTNFVAPLLLMVGGSPAELVPDEEWWDPGNTVPPRRFYRIAPTGLEIYPAPTAGTVLSLRYVYRPADLAADADRSALPYALHRKLVAYARSHALLKLRQYAESDRYMAEYEKDLPPALIATPPELLASQGGPKPRDLTDADLIAFYNDGLAQVAARTDCTQFEVTAAFGAGGQVPLPDRFLRVMELSVAGDDLSAQMVDSEFFDRWRSSAGAPDRTLARVFGSAIEVYPAPSSGVLYALRYAARPAPLQRGADKPEVPSELQPKAVDFARGQALWALGMYQQGDRWLAAYAEGLPGPKLKERFIPGPIDLTFEPSPFDEADAAHF